MIVYDENFTQSVTYCVDCDVPGCDTSLGRAHVIETMELVAFQATRDGWYEARGLWTCPLCLKSVWRDAGERKYWETWNALL